LNQDYPRDRYEIIIVDNKSNDNTSQIVQSYNVVYTEESDVQSSYAARNTGLKIAKGEIIAFIDSDCIADKSWLKNAVRLFLDAKVGLVAGGIVSSPPNNYIEEYVDRKKLLIQKEKEEWLPLPFAKTANAFYRREVLDKIGFFEQRWRSGGDMDLSWRMQLETGYTIKFTSESFVLHIHRSTLKSLFFQTMGWGTGISFISRKHKEIFPKRRFRQNLSDGYRLISGALILIYYAVLRRNMKEQFKKDFFLSYIVFLGWTLGRFKGWLIGLF
jgi:cellulose synthase/poly-beta-1,6-N-acetylglucosamine synthase-like glycosyltransferase